MHEARQTIQINRERLSMKEVSNSHPTVRKLFEGRKVVIPAGQGNALILRPLISQYLGCKVLSVEGVSFADRKTHRDDPVISLRKRILSALKASGQTVGFGNEAAIAPHLHLPRVHCTTEAIMLIDLENDIEIFHAIISTQPISTQREITTLDDLTEFAELITFPLQGLILKRTDRSGVAEIQKDIFSWEALHPIAYRFLANSGNRIVAQSDIRPCLNPGRMQIIETATKQLLTKVLNLCPSCLSPGFKCAELRYSDMCNPFDDKKDTPASKIYVCGSCDYQDERFVV